MEMSTSVVTWDCDSDHEADMVVKESVWSGCTETMKMKVEVAPPQGVLTSGHNWALW